MKGLLGRYCGEGRWHEADGRAGGYSVEHRISGTETGFRFVFRHMFDNLDPDVDAAFDMAWVTEELFTVAAGGAEIGRGYAFDGFCHYTLQMGATIVEVSCVLTDEGLRLYGSSSVNKAGNAIAWREQLKRTAHD